MAENNTIPEASSDDQAAIHAILAEQGLLGGDGGAVDTEIADPEPVDAEGASGSEPEAASDDPEDAVASEIEAEAKGEEVVADKGEEKKAEEEPAANAKSMASVARREALVQQREQQVAARERAMAMGQDQSRQRAETAEATLSAWRRLALEDPGALYEGLGEKDLVGIAARIYYKKHPEAAPPTFKEQSRVDALQREIEDLRRQAQERDHVAASQAREADQIAYLTAEAKTLPDDLEYIKREAVEEPAVIGREMLDRLNHLRSKRDPELMKASYILDPDERDKAITIVIAKSLNDEKQKVVERTKKVHLKSAAPAVKPPAPAVIPAEKKPGKKTISSKIATAHTRPVVGNPSHEEDIDKVISDFVTGKVPFGE